MRFPGTGIYLIWVSVFIPPIHSAGIVAVWFLVMANSKHNAGSNARAAERYRLILPTVMWELGDARDRAVPTETMNISRTGLFLRGEFPMRRGSMISFEVKLPPVGAQPGGTMIGQATVVRNDSTGRGRTGIGALIHQCEVRPAGGTPRGRRASTGSGRGQEEKRAGRERRTDDRRAKNMAKRKVLKVRQERRHSARRSSSSRRRG